MHAVFCLIPDNGLRAVYDFSRDLFATMRGQAVHKQGLGFGRGHHLRVHTPIGKGFFARFVFGLIAHAGPDIGGH